MNILKKIFTIFFLITYSLFAVSFEVLANDKTPYFERELKDIKSFCQDSEDLTFEKISGLTLEELKEKCQNVTGVRVESVYAISKLKNGEKHVSIQNGSEREEYFRLNAIDKIINFFKTKIYDYKAYEKGLKEAKIKGALSLGLFGGLFTYAYTHLLNKITEYSENKKVEKSMSNEENSKSTKKRSVSHRVILAWSVLSGLFFSGLGLYLKCDSFEREMRNKHIDAKLKILGDFEHEYKKLEDSDYIKIHFNPDDPRSSSISFNKANIKYTDEEKKYISENAEDLIFKILDAVKSK